MAIKLKLELGHDTKGSISFSVACCVPARFIGRCGMIDWGKVKKREKCIHEWETEYGDYGLTGYIVCVKCGEIKRQITH